MEQIEATLITGRTIGQGIGIEVGKTSESYSPNVNYIELNPDDASLLNAKQGTHLMVSNESGEVVLYCHPIPGVRRGYSFVPYGLWANQVIPSYTAGTGTPHYKGVKVKISVASDREVSDVEELVKKIKEES